VERSWRGHVRLERTTLVLVLTLSMVAWLLAEMPTAAHPIACDITDDAELDAACEEEVGGGKEGGEELDGDSRLEGVDLSAFDYTRNMHPLGFSQRNPVSNGDLNSDLAFWGDHAYQGHYSGFRILDVTDPADPIEIVDVNDCGVSRTSGVGQQGDVIVWEDILVRSWDGSAGGTCQGLPGVSGLHVFDISDKTAPQAIGYVNLPAGSHTATAVPDLDNDRLLIYSSPSGGGRSGVDIVEVPLSAPQDIAFLSFLPSGLSGQLPNLVTVDEPSSAAGTYQANSAAFGPAPSAEGIAGDIVVVDDGSANPTLGCEEFVDFPEGAIALVDRGVCPFAQKAVNAQAAGATALIVANNAAGTISMGGTAAGLEIPSVMVSLADGNAIKAGLPASGSVSSNPAPPLRPCHDTGVILGDAMLAACAGGNGFTVWSMHPDDGGSLEQPVLLYGETIPGVSIGHSASFSWDGEILIFGHEPGGGSQAQCQATTPEINRSLFFYEARTGVELGRHVLPRPQTAQENCTLHNYNVVPTDKHRILVHGSYQSGIGVVNFTDPANAVEIAYADPDPLVPTQLGGDWSSYWYDGRIYQSDIRRGLLIWNLSDPHVAGAKKLGHLNPQTQEFTIPFRGTAFGRDGSLPARGPRG
jgi:hypothetical protein